ncbi:type IV toxin-antitoxin system AbiEi family antitoxin domain-containing protein [Tenggerimyces flavus]|uniref:DUF559 domain-containing protein n=1 Tax=Tenggerimyces flavus TaxID=1708749 RepID=A0ABV7YCI1_9ACTN|nr:type IV toxin-antitoxin system AbiEi family antitoxin domain-containing protein [Tenggerimyces flavus]MBM7788119.1 hypothetical protein [Tenggerimyces flavus]
MPRRRKIDHHALESLVARHQGVVRGRELERLGIARQTISYRTAVNGSWQRVLPGIVATHSGPTTMTQRLIAAHLYAGTGSILTGLTALRLYGVRAAANCTTAHLLIPHDRRRAARSYVVVERTRRLPSHRWRITLPCSPVARATIDATRRLDSIDAVRELVAEVVQRNLCSVSELILELRAAPSAGSRLPRLAVREIAAGIRSVAEAKLRRALLDAKIVQPHWNCDLFSAADDWLARPDAVWPDLGVALELDSLAWHLSPQSYRRTQARQRRMTKYGLLVLPVAPGDVETRLGEILDEIRQTLETARQRVPPTLRVRPQVQAQTAA